MHARGSQGANGSTLGVGAWNAPELPVFPLVPAVVGVVLDVGTPAGAVVVVAGGALTVKSVPVTTVTC